MIPEPGFRDTNLSETASDILFVPSDSAYFRARSHILLGASQNGFNYLLPSHPSNDEGYFWESPLISVPEISAVFNVMIRAIYRVSCAHYTPSFETLAEAIRSLRTYGVTPSTRLPRSTTFCYHMLRTVPLTYTRLLSFLLFTLTDEMAERIGPIFLKQLFCMHFGRVETLRCLLFPPPDPHDSTPTCCYEQREKVTRAWILTAISLALEGAVGAFSWQPVPRSKLTIYSKTCLRSL